MMKENYVTLQTKFSLPVGYLSYLFQEFITLEKSGAQFSYPDPLDARKMDPVPHEVTGN